MDRMTPIGQNGNDGLHYDCVAIDGVVYRKNPNCIYAMYLHVKTGSWRVSALVKNDELEVGMSDKSKKMVLMLLRELRYYYGDFNFDLFNDDIKQLLELMKSEDVDSSCIPDGPYSNIENVRLVIGYLEKVKEKYGW